MKSIGSIRQIQDTLDDHGIIFCYSGYITEDILVNIGKMLRQKMEIVKADKNAARAIFAIFVEEAQNLIRYSSGILSDDKFPSTELRQGFIAVGNDDGSYYVCSGNLIMRRDVERLQTHLEHIKTMDQAKLKKVYKEVLKGDVPEFSKGAGVGFLDIARRAKSGIDFNFSAINDDLSYFTLKAFI